MSVQTDGGPRIDIEGHVGDRWEDRVGEPRANVEKAWHNGEEVIAPLVNGNARLIARDGGRDLLLVERDGRLRTVLYADKQRLVRNK